METTTHHIEMDPAFRNGRPRIVGTRLTVSDIVIMHFRMGLSVEEIGGKYDVELGDVHAALTHYYDHRAEIDKDIGEDEAFVEAFRSQCGSDPSWHSILQYGIAHDRADDQESGTHMGSAHPR